MSVRQLPRDVSHGPKEKALGKEKAKALLSPTVSTGHEPHGRTLPNDTKILSRHLMS